MTHSAKRWSLIAAFLVAFILLFLWQMPITAGYKAECDSRGGFYDYKSTACWSDQGYEIMAWK